MIHFFFYLVQRKRTEKDRATELNNCPHLDMYIGVPGTGSTKGQFFVYPDLGGKLQLTIYRRVQRKCWPLK